MKLFHQSLCLGLFLLTSFANAQSASQPVLQNEIRLRPSILSTQVQTVEEFGQRPISDTLEGRYVRLVRFAKILNKASKKQLQADGIQLEGYVPYQSYLLSIPVSFARQKLANFQATHIVTLSPENKASQPLWNAFNGSRANQEESLELVVELYESVSIARVEKELNAFGGSSPYGSQKNARLLKTTVSQVASLLRKPFVRHVEIEPGVPVPDDTKGRSLHRSNAINTSYNGGLKYDGRGVSIALADDGHVGPHIDFKGRLTSFTTSNEGSHGDMTTGICIGAANIDPRYKGMATGSNLYLFNIGSYPQINNAIPNLANLKTVITSTSYSQGCNQYTSSSADGDNKLKNNTPLTFVFSGGNNGTADCQYGAGPGRGNITGGYKNGKNTIATGNIDANGNIDPSSSRGPAPDGRIKPDICANGLGQMSTDENYTYSVGGGTSAACPGLAGVTAQLYHAWREIKQEANPDGALIKGILLNTADDLGKTGPDFVYGWGRVNARKALQTIQKSQYFTDSLEDGDSATFSLNIPAGTQQMKVMLYWADPAGLTNSTINLVNNLDLQVRRPDGSILLPWKLNSAPVASLLNTAAGFGKDSLNNMEQVSLSVPTAGIYQFRVSGASIPDGPQRFYVTYMLEDSTIALTYPIGGEDFAPGQAEVIRWDAPASTTPFRLEYSANNGQTWTTISNPTSTARQASWTVPSSFVTGEGLVRLSRGSQSVVSHRPFSCINPPGNLRVTKACLDSITLAWNAVTGASLYQVYFLGEKYMDSVAITTGTQITLPYDFSQTLWYSVGAIFPNGNKGRRALAKQKTPGVINCILSNDIQLARTISPKTGLTYNCQSFSNYPVSIRLRNKGISPASGITVTYRLNSLTPVTETVPGSLAPGDSIDYLFTTSLNLNPSTIYKLTVVAKMSTDPFPINDSSIVSFNTSALFNGTLTQTFQSLTFPPANWTISNPAFTSTWARSEAVVGPTGFTTTAAKMDNFTTNQAGSKDYLQSPVVDLTNMSLAVLTFDRAYAPRANRADSLLIQVSTDCGASFVPTAYAKNYAQLATAPAQVTLFAPATDADWQPDTLNMTPFVGNKIIVRFVAVSRFGNALFVDNVRLNGFTVSVLGSEENEEFRLYPNPAETAVQLLFPHAIGGRSTARIYAQDGRLVSSEVLSAEAEQTIDIQRLPPGIYQILIETGEERFQARFQRR